VVAAGRLPPNAPAPAVHRNGTLFAADDGAIVTADKVLCAGHYSADAGRAKTEPGGLAAVRAWFSHHAVMPRPCGRATRAQPRDAQQHHEHSSAHAPFHILHSITVTLCDHVRGTLMPMRLSGYHFEPFKAREAQEVRSRDPAP
jgi:hypothetical protein